MTNSRSAAPTIEREKARRMKDGAIGRTGEEAGNQSANDRTADTDSGRH